MDEMDPQTLRERLDRVAPWAPTVQRDRLAHLDALLRKVTQVPRVDVLALPELRAKVPERN